MESRVSVISIMVKDEKAAGEVNQLLHQFRQYVVGRMGIPYRERGISIISVVLDAPQDATSSLRFVIPPPISEGCRYVRRTA